MRAFCETHGLPVARQWRTCFGLCVGLYGVPYLLINLYGAMAIFNPGAPSVQMNNAWFLIPLVFVVLAPLIYLLSSLHQTRRQLLKPPPDPRRGFEPILPAT